MTTHDDFISAADVPLDQLRSILFETDDRKGQERTPWSDLDPVVAASLLASKAYPGRADDLEGLLFDEDRDPRVRANAAIGFALPLEGVEDVDVESRLVEALDIDDDVVRRGVFTALGYVGGEAAADAVAAYLESADRVVPEAYLAEALIVHRHSLDRHARLLDHGDVADLGEEQPFSIEVTAASDDLLSTARRDFERHPLRLDVASQQGYEIRCLGQRLVVLLDETLADDVGSAAGRQSLAGVLLSHRAVEVERWVPSHYLFLRPARAVEGKAPDEDSSLASGRLFVTGTDGHVRYTGPYVVEDDSVTFELRAVERAGLRPIEIVGRFEAGELRFERAVTAGRQPDREAPSAAPRER